MKLIEMQEAARMFRRARRVRRSGFRRYDGDEEAICRQIIADCWDEERHYFRVSNGHFCEFYVRDFAHCAGALVTLGYEEKVVATLRYALQTFQEHGRIEQTISPKSQPFSFPAYSPDALALLLHTLVITKQEKLAKEYHDLLQQECDRFAAEVIDAGRLLPKRHKRFSGMRDHVKRQAACYDAAMVLLVAKYAPRFQLKFPYKIEDLAEIFLQTYWNGEYFYSDATQQPMVVGDAQIFPFWTGILADVVKPKELAAMRAKTFRAVHRAGLDDPWPLRYTNSADAGQEHRRLHFSNLFANGYQTDSIWMNTGLCMLEVLASDNPKAAKKHVARIGQLIKQHGTFLEVYDKTGAPFKTFWYVADEGMLWCASWLVLRRALV